MWMRYVVVLVCTFAEDSTWIRWHPTLTAIRTVYTVDLSTDAQRRFEVMTKYYEIDKG
jgi:hypothetical protein